MCRSRSRSWASRFSTLSSRLTKISWWRSVSTTSMASISSSSFRGACPAASPGGAADRSTICRQRRAFSHQAGDAPLTVLDGVADLRRVLRREPAHLADDLQGMLLEGDHRVHKLLDRISPDGRAIASLHGSLTNLIANLGQHLQAARDALFHLVQGLRGFMEAKHASKRCLQRREHRIIGREEGNCLSVDALLGVRHLHQPRHDYFGGVVADGQVVREVFSDLVTFLLILGPAQMLVAGEL